MAKRKVDPIRGIYYKPWEDAEVWEDRFFAAAATVSLLILFIERHQHPDLYNVTQVAFLIVVMALFFIGHWIRQYLSPRAEGSRRDDLLAHSFSVVTAEPRTVGYYNNNQTEPFRKLGANAFESTLFSKEIARHMLHKHRAKTAVYGTVWLVTATYQRWDMALTAVLAQALFSEQVVSKWLRLEWLTSRFETSYKKLARLFEAIPTDEALLQRRVLEAVFFYETSKASAGIILSSETFAGLNESLNQEWEGIRGRLNL